VGHPGTQYPINQQEMAYTLLTFCYRTGLERMGVAISLEDAMLRLLLERGGPRDGN
jgi:hypothetical protein